jgi:hypothetical protein
MRGGSECHLGVILNIDLWSTVLNHPHFTDTQVRTKPINACRFVRKMRGGAQAHLIECDGGVHYVVKFLNNPQHRRILVNEWISSVFLAHLGIAAPRTSIINVTREFLESNPETYLQLGARRQEVEPGWHFGSAFPGDPATTAVYDFLPDALLGRVVNLRDFAGALVFDKWMGNADARQTIFFRAAVKDRVASDAACWRNSFVGYMMDHGYVFEGPHWRFRDSPLQGLYFRPMVYDHVRSWQDLEPWLECVRHFPEDVVYAALKSVPREWLANEEPELEALLERLMTRRLRVPDLIEESARSAHIDAFPNWERCGAR